MIQDSDEVPGWPARATLVLVYGHRFSVFWSNKPLWWRALEQRGSRRIARLR